MYSKGAMRTIKVSDEVYEALERRAADDGMSVEMYLRDMLESRPPASDNLDHRFTPEIVADLERIADRMRRTGEGSSIEEVERRFVQRRNAWIEENAA